MDLDSLLVSLYVLVVDDWWQADHHGRASRGPGRPALLADSEVLTLAILASAASATSGASPPHTPARLLPEWLCTQGQFNRRVRALEPKLRAVQRTLA
jgi:hypothetical protein